jgi:hypothetical protein
MVNLQLIKKLNLANFENRWQSWRKLLEAFKGGPNGQSWQTEGKLPKAGGGGGREAFFCLFHHALPFNSGKNHKRSFFDHSRINL